MATTDEMTVLEVLEVVCDKRQLSLSDCFLRIKHAKDSASDYFIPQPDQVFEKLVSCLFSEFKITSVK